MAHGDKSLIQLSGELVSKRSKSKTVVSAEAVYDYLKGKSQEEINAEGNYYIGEEEPQDACLWIDPQNNSGLPASSAEELAVIRAAVSEIQAKITVLERPVVYGVAPGDSTDSTRTLLIHSAVPERPSAIEGEDTEEEDEDDGTEKPDISSIYPTVASVSCKLDTSVNFSRNRSNLVNGEIIFYTDSKKLGVYYDGQFHLAGSGSSGSGGISLEDLYSQDLEYLHFQDADGGTFRVFIDDSGRMVATPKADRETSVGSAVGTWNVYVSHLLCINSVYAGGDGGDKCQCSHNFVELANGGPSDISLKGLYLLYTDLSKENDGDSGYKWDWLALDGTIKAGGTFLVRGARCNTSKRSFMPIDEYDMVWSKDGSPIEFKQGRALFYLCVGDAFKDKLASNSMGVPYDASNSSVTPTGYIDSCGFGPDGFGEGNSPLVVRENGSPSSDWDRVLFVRCFPLEPAKQGNKAYSARKTSALWTYIDLERQTRKLSGHNQYYWDDVQKGKQAPHASYSHKDFFTNKTSFKELEPNYLNVLFGRQATDGGEGKRATRCFNWVSVGYYDEYVEYRKATDTTWTRSYSITEDDASNSEDTNKFIEHYRRFRWRASDGTLVTTHKCIVRGLSAGEYEYRVGRENSPRFASHTLSFTVRSDEDVAGKFSFIQVTDQQAFNWHEYTAWWKVADCIRRQEVDANGASDFDFLVNTGDITQSGNRASEWLDYYSGKQALSDKVEMFSIGNNDLCGYDSTELTDGNDATSKYSHVNVLRYFCFELDPNNDYTFEWEGTTYPIYSLYSFNYGKLHFVCLNSEIAQASSKMYKGGDNPTYAGDKTFAESANARIEEWLKRDLQLWKGINGVPSGCSDCIVYMHEMPFTMVTWSFCNSNKDGAVSPREGSHLNTLNANGLYRFSRLFKQYGIKLVFGGHKHTYTISKPIYDAPEGYIGSDNKPSGTVGLLDAFAATDSVKPVIQVTDAKDIPSDSRFARYEVVSKIDAPTYVMSQASGYKLVSNKEQPSDDEFTIPWLLSYFKQPSGTRSGTKENVAQHYPMYIRYDIDVINKKVTITAKQVHGVWNVNLNANSASFNMNEQSSEPVSSTAMTLSRASSEDKSAYGINNDESLTIEL